MMFNDVACSGPKPRSAESVNYAGLAQLVAQHPCNVKVMGSTPLPGTISLLYCGRSIMVVRLPSKQIVRVQFPSTAPFSTLLIRVAKMVRRLALNQIMRGFEAYLGYHLFYRSSQVVRQRALTSQCIGSNPISDAICLILAASGYIEKSS